VTRRPGPWTLFSRPTATRRSSSPPRKSFPNHASSARAETARGPPSLLSAFALPVSTSPPSSSEAASLSTATPQCNPAQSHSPATAKSP
jgi:hypothetical protein